MAEKAVVAFGRYLKLLRERRGLSLDDVAALTKAYPEPVNKGYLSRAERGLSHIGFSKVVALGRAYEVPVDVFGEKWSLDLEVEHLKDPPETRGLTLLELLQEASRLSRRGARLEAYALCRESADRARREAVLPNYRDRAEQVAATGMSLGVAAGSLGRYRLSKYEVECALSDDALSADYLPVASIHLSVVNRRQGNFPEAQRLVDRAVAEADRSPSKRFLGDAIAARALLSNFLGDHSGAIDQYKKASRVFSDRGQAPERARTLANLASAYFDAGRIKAARRTLDAAFRIATEAGAGGVRSRARILLGEIELLENRPQKAVTLWLEALEIAKRSHDRTAAFKAEFQLFKNALTSGHLTAANAFGRRLNRLWPWIAADEPEVRDFRALWAAHRPARKTVVATEQHERSR